MTGVPGAGNTFRAHVGLTTSSYYQIGNNGYLPCACGAYPVIFDRVVFPLISSVRVWGLPRFSSRVSTCMNIFRARVGLTLVDLRKTPVHKSILSG